MQKRFVQVKRYGGEGAESMMPAVDEILRAASECKNLYNFFFTKKVNSYLFISPIICFFPFLPHPSPLVDKVWDLVFCMPHRGRLNLLTDSLKFPAEAMFAKVKGEAEFPSKYNEVCIGDVLSHLHTSVDLDFGGEKPVHVSMLPNPSHLEACNPVALGKTRARQLYLQDGDYRDAPECKLGDKVLCVQLHGDAAFAAQVSIRKRRFYF